MNLSKEDLVKYTKKLTKKLKLVEEERDQLLKEKEDRNNVNVTNESMVDEESAKQQCCEHEQKLNLKQDEYNQLIDRMRQLLAKYKELQMNYNQLKESSSETKANVDTVQTDDGGNLENENEQLKSENKKLFNDMQELDGKHQQIVDSLKDSEAERKKLSSENKDLLRMIEAKVAMFEQLSNEFESFRKESSQDLRLVPELRDQLQHSQSENEALRKNLEESRTSYMDMQKTQMSEIEALKFQLQNTLKEYQSAEAALITNNRELEDELETCKRQLEVLKSSAADQSTLHKQFTDLQESFDSLTVSHQDTLFSLKQAEKKLDETIHHTNIDMETNQHDEIESLRQQLESKISEHQYSESELNFQLNQLQLRNEQLNAQLVEAQQASKDLGTESSQVMAMQQQLEILQKEIDDLSVKYRKALDQNAQPLQTRTDNEEIHQAKLALAMDCCFVATSKAIEKEKELQAELTSTKSLVMEWRKKASELAKRYKMLKSSMGKQSDDATRLKANQIFSLMHVIFQRYALTKSFSQLHRFAVHEAKATMFHPKQLEERLNTLKHEMTLEIEEASHRIEECEKKKQALEVRVQDLESTNTGLTHKVKSHGQLPETFDPKTNMICVVDVPDREPWIGYLDQDGSLKWVSKSDLTDWCTVHNHPISLPPSVQQLLERNYSRSIEEAKERLATSLSETEMYKSDLANYKRRAQLALQKAQDDIRKAEQRASKADQQLLQSTQNELTRITKQYDEMTLELERLREEHSQLDAALLASQKEVEKCREENVAMDSSITTRIELIREELQKQHAQSLAEEVEKRKREKMSFDEDTNRINDRIHKQEQELMKAKEAYSQLLLSHANLENELDLQKKEYEELETTMNATRQRRSISELEEQAFLQSPAMTPRESAMSAEADPVRFSGTSNYHMETKTLAYSSNNNLLQSFTSNHVKGNDHDVADDASHVSNESSNLLVGQMDSMHDQVMSVRIHYNGVIDELNNTIEKLQFDLHESREQQRAVTEKLEDIQRSQSRVHQLVGDGKQDATEPTQNLTYLKNVVLKYMCATDNASKLALLPVIVTILQFSPKESADVKNKLEAEKGGGVTSWIWGAT